MFSMKVNNMGHPRSKTNMKTYKPDDIILIFIDEILGKASLNYLSVKPNPL